MPRQIHDAAVGFNTNELPGTHSDGTLIHPSALRVQAAGELITKSGLAALAATDAFPLIGTKLVSWSHTPSGAVSALVTTLQQSLAAAPGAGDWDDVGTLTSATAKRSYGVEIGPALWGRIVVSTLTQIGAGTETVAIRAIVQG